MAQAKSRKNNSTIVRLFILGFFVGVACINLIGIFWPQWGAQLATRIFLTTRRGRRTKEEEEILSQATQTVRQQGAKQVIYYRWGSGPMVLLVHGWNGRGSQLGTMVPALLEAGYGVMTFDAIGHGDSEGRQAKIFDLAEGVRVAEKLAGSLHGIITHSMGGAASTLALSSGVSADRLVFVAPPYRPLGWIDQFTQIAKVSRRIGKRMKDNFQITYGERWKVLHDSSLLQKMKGNLLVIHDERDRQVPQSEGKVFAEAWPGAQFISTRGLGHNRILKDPEVIRQAVKFIQDPKPLNLKYLNQGENYENPNSIVLGKMPEPVYA